MEVWCRTETDSLSHTLSLPLSLNTAVWVNQEQSSVTVTNQSQLWKQTSLRPLISLVHLSLLCLSSTSSVPLLCPYTCRWLRFLFFPLLLLCLLVFAFTFRVHLSSPLLPRGYQWRKAEKKSWRQPQGSHSPLKRTERPSQTTAGHRVITNTHAHT